MHNIRTNFIKTLEVINDIIDDETNECGNYLKRCTKSKFSDTEVIALSLTAKCLGIDSENNWFSKLHTEYLNASENLIIRRQYKGRIKRLFAQTEVLRKSMAERIWHFEP